MSISIETLPTLQGQHLCSLCTNFRDKWVAAGIERGIAHHAEYTAQQTTAISTTTGMKTLIGTLLDQNSIKMLC